ncbi:MAG: hypothetical protein M3320_07125 [Actinomycetota bacterium]|nr:hypothetical protein [Actinomycetota bacterium]MDQ5808434.1 hypothetical protein [Actinomycetota bacterium]
MSADADTHSGAVAAEPTPTVAGGERTSSHPAGSALPEGGVPATEKPEVLVGAAFAGGFLAAMILKKIVG